MFKCLFGCKNQEFKNKYDSLMSTYSEISTEMLNGRSKIRQLSDIIQAQDDKALEHARDIKALADSKAEHLARKEKEIAEKNALISHLQKSLKKNNKDIPAVAVQIKEFKK